LSSALPSFFTSSVGDRVSFPDDTHIEIGRRDNQAGWSNLRQYRYCDRRYHRRDQRGVVIVYQLYGSFVCQLKLAHHKLHKLVDQQH
jgi:hypothetical protein